MEYVKSHFLLFENPSDVSDVSFFFFFLPCCIVCGILVPQPGLEPTPLAVRVWRPRQLPNQMFHCKNHFADICYTFIEFLILCLAPGLKNTVQLCEAV